MTQTVTQEDIIEVLKNVYDPEIHRSMWWTWD
jgi:metal-sulfur cluster biosynthetic enzyme